MPLGASAAAIAQFASRAKVQTAQQLFAADKRHSDERTRRGVHCQKGSDTFDKARSTFSPGTPAADCFDATLREQTFRASSVRARLYILFNRPRPKLLLNIRITPPQSEEIYLEISTPC